MLTGSRKKTWYVVQLSENTALDLKHYCKKIGSGYDAILRRLKLAGRVNPGFVYIIKISDKCLVANLKPRTKTFEEKQAQRQFFEKVEKAVKLAGSKNKLADILGVHYSTVKDWANRKTYPIASSVKLVNNYLKESEKFNERFSRKLKPGHRVSRKSN